jgi:hypothetical protein
MLKPLSAYQPEAYRPRRVGITALLIAALPYAGSMPLHWVGVARFRDHAWAVYRIHRQRGSGCVRWLHAISRPGILPRARCDGDLHHSELLDLARGVMNDRVPLRRRRNHPRGSSVSESTMSSLRTPAEAARLGRCGPLVALAVVATAALNACASTLPPSHPSVSPSPSDYPILPSFSAAPTASPTASIVGLPIGPVPKGFVPASVTFISLNTGWVLGAAPCASTTCLVLLKTVNAGRTWVSVTPPPTPFSGAQIDDPASVGEIRFADSKDGWAYAPALWATHDGGVHWHQILLPSHSSPGIIDDVEAARGTVHAALRDYNGFARIETSPYATDRWHESTILIEGGAGPVPHATIVLSGDSGWVVQVDRTITGGARFERNQWSTWQPPCETGGGGLYLAAATATNLAAVCTDGQWGNFPTRVVVSFSSNAGATFSPARRQPAMEIAGGAASPRSGEIVVWTLGAGGNVVQLATFNGGATWEKVFGTNSEESENDLGFTSASQGVAILSGHGGASGELIMTFDGGHTWTPVPFRQAST